MNQRIELAIPVLFNSGLPLFGISGCYETLGLCVRLFSLLVGSCCQHVVLIYSLRLSLTKKKNSSHCLNYFFTFFLPALLLLAINPCQDGTHGCHSNADCLYLRPGRNNCTCAAGYTGDGTVCIGMLMFKMDCA